MDSFIESWMRDSATRSRNEKRVIDKPENHIQRLRELISSWRKYETCVVFGNLGRQPHLLEYYLDMCFGSEDDVRVTCEWPVSFYQTGGSDFLILVEPYFGFCVKKPPTTRHLVVLTSHMSLTLCDPSTKMYLVHLRTRKNFANPHLAECEVFKPPILHTGPLDRIPNSVLLDVTGAKSAWEAYLRLLTGREIIRKRPFKVRVNDRHRRLLEAHMALSKREAERHWPDSHLEDVYWNGFF